MTTKLYMANFLNNYKYFLIVLLLIILEPLILIFFAQPIISKTGGVHLFWFAGGIEDSQQIFDWYSFSHIIHGILFYFLFKFIFKKSQQKDRPDLFLFLAVLLESAWEVLENSPIIIERYRQTALAAGYFGDSVINSFFDLVFMIGGFYFAKKYGWKVALAVVIFFELLTLYFIRDNLTLNIIMLIYPIDAINLWQVGG